MGRPRSSAGGRQAAAGSKRKKDDFFEDNDDDNDEFFVQGDGLVVFGIHEVVALVVGVAEFQLLAVHVHRIHFFRRGKPDVGGLAGADVTDDALHEGAQVAGGAVLDIEDDGRISIVTDCHAFAEIICCCHVRGLVS